MTFAIYNVSTLRGSLWMMQNGWFYNFYTSTMLHVARITLDVVMLRVTQITLDDAEWMISQFFALAWCCASRGSLWMMQNG